MKNNLLTSWNSTTFKQLIELKRQLQKCKTKPLTVENRKMVLMLNHFELKLAKTYPEWKKTRFMVRDKFYLTSFQQSKYRRYLPVRV